MTSISAQTLPQAGRQRPVVQRILQHGARWARLGGKWWHGGWFRGLVALAAVYLFVSAIDLIGNGLKTVATVPAGKAAMESAYAYAAHPLAGLCLGVLLTAIVQSSSFTTTFVVGLVAGQQISLATAVPVIMGANVGTSVTNLLVSLAHLRHRQEFRRSLAGALVHDIFNLLSALVLMPLELAFGVLSRPAGAVGNWLEGAAFFTQDPKKFNFVKMAIKPVGDFTEWLLRGVLKLPPTAAGIVEAALAVVLLFVALFLLVKMLRGLMKDRLSGLFSRTLFRNGPVAFVAGLLTTAAVQSSSVTTSLVVPLVGAGVLTVRQIFPYTLGANIGTTVTAMLGALALAALAAGTTAAAQAAAAMGLAVAFSHLLFNAYGTAIFWPLKFIPLSLAEGYARLASERRVLAGVYILVLFFVVPILVIIAVNL